MTLKASPEATCRACEKQFLRMRSTQSVCSVPCARKLVAEGKKAERANTERRKEAVKSRSQWLKEAQSAFNAWIRARDAGKPCISCGRQHNGQWHAGHYLSTGARPELRFDEFNVHKQCAPCNTHLSGNLVLYRIALMDRVGPVEVDRLEGPHAAQKWSIEDLKAIKADYLNRVKEARK